MRADRHLRAEFAPTCSSSARPISCASPLPDGRPDAADLQARSNAPISPASGSSLPSIRANLVNLNTLGDRPAARPRPAALIDPAGRRGSLAAAQTGTRPVWFDGGWHDTPVYWRDHLPVDAPVAGPAIVEQMDTTIVIEPGDRAAGDGDGNLIVTIGGAP